MKTIPESDWLKLACIAYQFEKTARAAGLLGGQITQATAFRMYGRERVERWRRSGKVNPVKSGSRIFYNSDELINQSLKNQLS